MLSNKLTILHMFHKSIYRAFPSVLLLLLFITSCSIDEQTFPNSPQLDPILSGASEGDLNLLVTGIEASMRNGWAGYVTASGSIAREFFIFDADPRNTSDVLGKGDAVLDNNTFYLTGPYSTRYRVVKNANILLEAVDNSGGEITEAQRDGYRGFANTIKAFMFAQMLDYLGTNGVRVDVAEVENPGPFLGQEEGYDFILGLFDTALEQMDGGEFLFTLSDGFDGYRSPETFARVNRALAARTATRAGRYAAALELVDSSFFDLEASLSLGVQHVFSTTAGDLLNPLFRQAGQSGDQLVVNPRIIADIDSSDARISKFRLRAQEGGQDDLNGRYETALYPEALSPIDIIRNEELILIWAEANLQTGDLDDAVTGLNTIRNAYGLGDLDDTVVDDRDALIDDLIYQRTYSLWGEGHQMFDLRRYGRLNADFLPIDREGDDIFTQFPIPLAEGQ